jgi:hypothetical protein
LRGVIGWIGQSDSESVPLVREMAQTARDFVSNIG